MAAIPEQAILAEVTPGAIQVGILEAVRGAAILIPAVVAVAEGHMEEHEMGDRTSKIIRKCSHSFILRSR